MFSLPPALPFPSPPHLSVFLFLFTHLKTNFCSPDIPGYVVFHWSRVDLPGTTLLLPLSWQLTIASSVKARGGIVCPLPSPCGPCSGLLAQALYDWRLIACSCPATSRISCSLVVVHHLWLLRLPTLLPSEIPEPCGGQCGTCVPPRPFFPFQVPSCCLGYRLSISAHLLQGLIMAHRVVMSFLLIKLIPEGQCCVSIFQN